MLAMSYQVTLPGSYDVDAFRQALDSTIEGWTTTEGLLFAAHGLTQANTPGATHHVYSPFFVWSNTSRMGTYLWGGEHFAQIEREFGRPSVQTWAVTSVQLGSPADNPESAAVAVLVVASATQGQTLAQRVVDHKADARVRVHGHDTAIAVRGIDPRNGAELSFDALYELPKKLKAPAHAQVIDLAGITLPNAS